MCDKCGVEVTRAKVRRERMGHIELAAPVSAHLVFPRRAEQNGAFAGHVPKALEQVLNFASFVVLDPKALRSQYKQMLTPASTEKRLRLTATPFKVGMGAEAIKELLTEVDLEKEPRKYETRWKRLRDKRRIKQSNVLK